MPHRGIGRCTFCGHPPGSTAGGSLTLLRRTSCKLEDPGKREPIHKQVESSKWLCPIWRKDEQLDECRTVGCLIEQHDLRGGIVEQEMRAVLVRRVTIGLHARYAQHVHRAHAHRPAIVVAKPPRLQGQLARRTDPEDPRPLPPLCDEIPAPKVAEPPQDKAEPPTAPPGIAAVRVARAAARQPAMPGSVPSLQHPSSATPAMVAGREGWHSASSEPRCVRPGNREPGPTRRGIRPNSAGRRQRWAGGRNAGWHNRSPTRSRPGRAARRPGPIAPRPVRARVPAPVPEAGAGKGRKPEASGPGRRR